MAHIIEEYSKHLGVKISKPVLKEHYFPLGNIKYITVICDETPSKYYPHFELVFDIIRPILQKEKIFIIQLEGNQPIHGANKWINGLSFKQMAFILSNSMLNVGPDCLHAQYCSAKNIRTVTLFGNYYSSIKKPYWIKGGVDTLIEPEWNFHPSYDVKDGLNQISSIKPERIAGAILKHLNKWEKINFKTLRIGEQYQKPFCEIIPTKFFDLRNFDFYNENLFPVFRFDFGFAYEHFFKYIENIKNFNIVHDELLDLDFLSRIRHPLSTFFFYMKDLALDIPEKYIESLAEMGIKFFILVDHQKDVKKIRNKYFDVGIEFIKQKRDGLKLEKDSLFLTKRKIIEGNKIYLSNAHRKKGLDNNREVLYNDDEFLDEIDYFLIYKEPANS